MEAAISLVNIPSKLVTSRSCDSLIEFMIWVKLSWRRFSISAKIWASDESLFRFLDSAGGGVIAVADGVGVAVADGLGVPAGVGGV